jgi:serine/threonine protein kinase
MAKIFTITEGLENMGALRTGGQGSVYKGRRMAAVITAVKLLPTPIHSENMDDKNFRDFQNEVEKLKKVNEHASPHVVKILHSGLTESGSLPFIEMEYIEGPDLEDLLKPPHHPVFTIREALKLAEQLAMALSHCHTVGVKHGDIKSNNIKFNNATGNYILLDFGLAIMSEEQRRSSLRNAGAVEFMAPEQYEGKMLFQSDVYSYGVVLYELLAGSVPFPLIDRHESARNLVMLAHIERAVPPLPELRSARMPVQWPEPIRLAESEVPAWLLALISKCLEKSPERRFADGRELLDAVLKGLEQSNSGSRDDLLLNSYKMENDSLRAELEQFRSVIKLKWVLGILVIILLGLSVYGINSIFDRGESIKTDSLPVVKENILPGDSLKKNRTDTNRPARASENKTVNPKRNKTAKDGLVDDVPYF